MGYTTEFEGSFEINGELSDEHDAIIRNFIQTHNNKIWDPKCRKECDPAAPKSACKWMIQDKCEIFWSGEEKFYDYVEWIEFLIQKFFIPWGYVVSGQVQWKGEEFRDVGEIGIENNIVTVESQMEIKKNLKSQVKKLTKLLEERDSYIKYLEEHINCSPDGKLALEAKADFFKLSLKEN